MSLVHSVGELRSYCLGFVYFKEVFMALKGVLTAWNISALVCYLAIFVLDNAIVAQNIMLFISAFFVFLANFFLVFRNNIIKTTIIDKSLKNEDEIAIYFIFYLHCFKAITEKKNELYISSLLKKHSNECVDLDCCCKSRALLYDPQTKSFGNPEAQPHRDKVFTKHYFLKCLREGV
jgi:hypothetical protein